MKKSFVLILFCFLFQSCAGMVNQMYSDFDREDGYAEAPEPSRGNFDLYRGNPSFQSNRRPPTTSLTGRQDLNSAEQARVMPAVQRQYEAEKNSRRRVRADDLRDNGSSGSLWASPDGKTKHLFTNARSVQNGDIVLINVFNKLKNEMTLELKRAFPTPLAATKEGDKKDAAAKPADPAADQVSTGQASQKAAGDENFDEGVSGANRVYDRISSVVIEQIDDQHLLLRGRKDVLYQNHKRLVEIQALVPKRDLNDNNTVSSDNILEQTITVLR